MPLLWISLSFILGLAAGEGLFWGGWLPLTLVLLFVLLVAWCLPVSAARFSFVASLRRLARPVPFFKAPPLFILLAFCAGGLRFTSAQSMPVDAAAVSINDQGKFRLVGVVSEPPDLREQSTLIRLHLETASPLDNEGRVGRPQQIKGAALALLPGRAAWQYGDRLVLDGHPVSPPGESENQRFSYSDYLARQGIYSYIMYPRVWLIEHGAGNPLFSAIYQLRMRAYREIYRVFPAPEAPLLAGILLGIESDIPPDLADAFQDTGTAHIIAISGFNIAILAALFSILFTRLLGNLLSRWWILVLTILSISAYTVLAGAGASVVRAAAMGSLGLLGSQLGRRSTGAAGLNTLAFTAAVMCLAVPRLPWDASFQLSFAATLGLMLYAAQLQAGFTSLASLYLPASFAQRLAGPVSEYMLFTLAAQLTTLPVILYHFQRVSISALLVNPLVLPVQPLIMVLSGLSVLVGIVLAPVGQFLAWIALPLTTYSIRVIEFFASFPGGVLTLPELHPLTALMCFAAITIPGLFSSLIDQAKKRLRSWLMPVVAFTAMGLLAALLLRAAAASPDGLLHVTILNQSGRVVALIQAPDGRRMLINTGASGNRLSAALGAHISPLDRRIDTLLVADCATGTVDSMRVIIERFTVDKILWACTLTDNRATQNLLQGLQKTRVESRLLEQDESFVFGQTLSIEVLSAQPEPAALNLVWQDFRMLIPGKLSLGSLDEKVLSPGVLVLSAADDQEFDIHQWRLLDPQVAVLVSDVDFGAVPPSGWVSLEPWSWLGVTTNGKQMWLEHGR